MDGRELVIKTMRGENPGRTPLYGWVSANLSNEISERFGSVAAFEDHYRFDMAHVFGGPAPFSPKIKELADSGYSFDEVVARAEEYCVKNCGLYFCLESLDALKGNGRLFNLAANVIEALRVKLICRRTDYGNISVAGKDLTQKRALSKLANLVAKDTEGCNLKGKACIISHVCCKEKAEHVKELISAACNYASNSIIVIKASGLNSLYASNGGIIVSFSK